MNPLYFPCGSFVAGRTFIEEGTDNHRAFFDPFYSTEVSTWLTKNRFT